MFLFFPHIFNSHFISLVFVNILILVFLILVPESLGSSGGGSGEVLTPVSADPWPWWKDFMFCNFGS